jgi:hypothetical protein
LGCAASVRVTAPPRAAQMHPERRHGDKKSKPLALPVLAARLNDFIMGEARARIAVDAVRSCIKGARGDGVRAWPRAAAVSLRRHA